MARKVVQKRQDSAGGKSDGAEIGKRQEARGKRQISKACPLQREGKLASCFCG